MSWLVNLWNWIRPKSRQEMVDKWLGSSNDLVELERRQQQLINPNLKGWI